MTKKIIAEQDLTKIVLKSMKRWQVPGATVGILSDGNVKAFSFGVTSRETNYPVRPDSLFQIGSISKVFTATMVMRLVAKNLLSLDVPIATYLPELKLSDKAAAKTITLRHLLSHASGLEGDRFEDNYGFGDDSLKRAIAEFDTLRQLYPPGSLWSYSNNGFSLVGAVIEQVTGKPFEAIMREQLFEPLKLERSFYFAHEAIAYPLVVGHTQVPKEKPEIARNYPLPRYVNPAGGIISNVTDLLRFGQAHMNEGSIDGKRLLPKKLTREMQMPQIDAANFAQNYGIGWAIYSNEPNVVLGHGGSTNGFQAQLTLAPDKQFAVAILTNGDAGSKVIRDVEDFVVAQYCDIRIPKRKPITMSKTDLARFTGVYKTRYTEVDIKPKDGGLRIVFSAKSVLANKTTKFPAMYAKPLSDREFLVTEGLSENSRFDFIDNSVDGGWRLRIGGRIADVSPPENG